MINSLILVAAGSGSRMQASLNKLLLTCEGHPLIYYTLRNVFKSHLLSELVIVTKPEERPVFESIVSSIPHRVKVLFAQGGEDRAGSVKNGFSLVSKDSDKVLVHDGARPLVDGETIDEAFRAISEENPAVAVGVPCCKCANDFIAPCHRWNGSAPLRPAHRPRSRSLFCRD